MNCEICNIHHDHAALYRVNPKGEKGIWRCEKCLTPEQTKEHEEGFELMHILEGKAK